MVWALLAVLSAVLLGVYDIFKKKSLQDNAVMPVLFFSTLTNAVIFFPVLMYSQFGHPANDSLLNFGVMHWTDHLLILSKSLIVGSSWVFAYYAVKHLPITIVSPIRSSGPLWTISGAVLIFGEKLNLLQWLGVIITVGFYYLFSLSGLKEGISFRKNKWVSYMVLATIIGSASALYDKFLLQHYNRIALQTWYHIYMVPIMLVFLFVLWYPNRHKSTPFQWRYTIPLIGVCLTLADFIYFWSLAYPNALVAIVSTIRRGSAVVSFTLGAIMFREKNIKLKAVLLAGIMIGIAIIILGGR